MPKYELKTDTIPGSSLVTLSARCRTGDKKAIEIKVKLQSMSVPVPDLLDAAISVRAGIFDRYIRQFIADNPKATIINVGCGFCTRFYEVDNGQITWIEVDLPDTLHFRNQVMMDDNPRHITRAADLVKGLPYKGDLIVAEGVLMFVPKPSVLDIVKDKKAIFDIRSPKQLNPKMPWGDETPYSAFNVVQEWRFGQKSNVLLVE